MSNHHSAVGSEKTKKYEIIRSHQAFTFGTVALDHTVVTNIDKILLILMENI